MIGEDAKALVAERFGLDTPKEGPLVPRERLVELARALEDLGYHFLLYVTATHYPAQPEKKKGDAVVEAAKPAQFVVAYGLRNLEANTEFFFRSGWTSASRCRRSSRCGRERTGRSARPTTSSA